MSAIETAAQALYNWPTSDKGWGNINETAREYWRGKARAAVASLREPSDVVVEAGGEFLSDTVKDWNHDPFKRGESGPVNDVAMATYLWERMIDAALAGELA